MLSKSTVFYLHCVPGVFALLKGKTKSMFGSYGINRVNKK